MGPPSESRVLAAVAVTLVLWASAFVAIRFAGRQLGPGELALARLLVGAVALGALMIARRERLPRGRALGAAAASGVLWFGVYNVALNAAERRIDAGTASLLVNTGPIFIALLAGSVLREGFPRRLVGGCLVSFAGVALIGVAVSRHGLHATWGAALCLLAALAYAIGVVAQKPALRSTSALSITWTACTVAAVLCLPWAPGLVGEAGRAHAAALAWTVYLGVFPTAIGFGLWAFALARMDAGRLGVSTYLVPPLAVVMGWLALAETPPLLALPGGLLCLAGVALARGRSREPVRPAGGTQSPPAGEAVPGARAARQPA
jgi:drug/metabolite transporter (DMT)-like permease